MLTKVDDTTFLLGDLKKVIKIPDGWEQETDDSVKLNSEHRLLAVYKEGAPWVSPASRSLAIGAIVGDVILCIKKVTKPSVSKDL